MSNQAILSSDGPAEDDLLPAELNLGKALALIHHVLPHIDEPDHAVRVQSSLRKAIACLQVAQAAHAKSTGVTLDQGAHSAVDAEIVAAIAAAISIHLGKPYRLMAVQPLAVPAPQFNAWAMEGRTHIFLSHKVR